MIPLVVVSDSPNFFSFISFKSISCNIFSFSYIRLVNYLEILVSWSLLYLTSSFNLSISFTSSSWALDLIRLSRLSCNAFNFLFVVFFISFISCSLSNFNFLNSFTALNYPCSFESSYILFLIYSILCILSNHFLCHQILICSFLKFL